MKNIDWNIIAKYLTREPLDETESFNVDGNDQEVKAAGETLNKVDRYLALKQFDTEAAWNQVNSQTQRTWRSQTRFVLGRNSMRIAASLIVLLLGSFVAYQVLHKMNSQNMQTIVAEAQVLVQHANPAGAKKERPVRGVTGRRIFVFRSE